MIGTPRPATVFTKQQRIAELARNGPEMAFTTLAHHIDINWMHMAYAQTRKDGAVGVDGRVRSRQCQGFPRNPGRFHPESGLSPSLDQLGAIEREASFL